MKESFGNSFVFILVITFLGILIAILLGSLSYSKSFKVKNRIIQILENYGEFHELTESDFANGDMINEINTSLASVGYRLTKNGINTECPSVEEYGGDNNYQSIELLNGASDYEYCVYKHSTGRGAYYSVIAYMYFDLPIIGDMIKVPLRSETKVIYNLCIDISGTGEVSDGNCR